MIQVFVFCQNRTDELRYLANYIALQPKGLQVEKNIVIIRICLIRTWPVLGSIHGAALAGPCMHLHVHLIMLI